MLAVNVIFIGAAVLGTLIVGAVFMQARELWHDVFVNHGALQTIQTQVAAGLHKLYAL